MLSSSAQTVEISSLKMFYETFLYKCNMFHNYGKQSKALMKSRCLCREVGLDSTNPTLLIDCSEVTVRH